MATILEEGAVIRGADLSEEDFGERHLADAQFDECTFRDVQLTGPLLQRAEFRNCRFIRCRFASADLRDAIFEHCNFADDGGHIGVQLAFSRLENARFESCEMSFAKFDSCDAYGLELKDSNLRGASIVKVDFTRLFGKKVTRTQATITNCRLQLADLTGISLPDCDLAGTSFREAVLRRADLSNANMMGCDLDNATTTGAMLSRANLRGASLTGMKLDELAAFDGLMISADQQQTLLSELGLDVDP